MGRKNDRARQARLQRKRNKRAAARSSRQSAAAPFPTPDLQEMLDLGIMLTVAVLLGGEPMSGSILEMARMLRRDAGGVAGRLPWELQAYLFEGAPWTLTLSEIQSVRGIFEENGGDELYKRLRSLALTAGPDLDAFRNATGDLSCAHEAAAIFDQLRFCLEDRKLSPTGALRNLSHEADRHGASTQLKRGYEKLMRNAITAVHTDPARLPPLLVKLEAELAEVAALAQSESADEAWWECGRVFLREEVLRRLAPGVSQLPVYSSLLQRLLDPPQAAVALAQSGRPEALQSIALGPNAREWSAYLNGLIDVGQLPFDERVRYEIARLKLLRAQVAGAEDEGETLEKLLSAFQSLQSLLSHGVPPQWREIPAAMAGPLVDYYVELVDQLHCEEPALQVTEALLRAHPADFRLACLYATGVVLKGEHGKLGLLAKSPTRHHVAPELFARCVRTCSRARRGMKAASTLRSSLFEPLDREDRKQCLIALLKQSLRRAATVSDHAKELEYVLPYVPRDSFLYGELQEKAALESSLVYLATLAAPSNNLKLALTEEQSQQWVSFAREIARQSSLAADLVQSQIKAPKGFTLVPSVLAHARESIGDFRPQPRSVPAAPPPPEAPPKRRKRSKRAKKEEDPNSQQKGLFDVPEP